jgi:16S rRNA (guanine(966)-N(2))-methyltransferase RsmD
MRIIAGSLRSRTLETPPGLATRPTSDRLRETLFNVLAPRIQGAAFLDLYAGSGAVGIEALSRGAARVGFVEQEPKALKALRGNLERLGISSGFRIDSSSVAASLKHLASELLADGALVIAEHRRKERLEDRYGSLERTRLHEQGDAALSFYAAAAG